MSRILRRRPSPSMIVAMVALCVALAGTATALPGRARVKKDDIARAAVRSVHIKSRAVAPSTSSHARRDPLEDRQARGQLRRCRPGCADRGQNIVESSLSTVPTATSATNAATVNSRTVEKISFLAPGGTAATRC